MSTIAKLLILLLLLPVAAPAQQQAIRQTQIVNLFNDLQQQGHTYGVDTGTADAYAVSITPAPTIVPGSVVVVKIANTNTGAATLSVNGSGATTVTTVTTGTPTPAPVPGGSTVVVSVANIDDLTTGWKICAVGSCGGGTPGGSSAPASFSQTFGNSSPSTDGASMKLTQTTKPGATQTNILFIHTGAACTGCTGPIWFQTHKRIYIDSSGGTPNNAEIDSAYELGGKLKMFGLQCNLSKHYWQIANDVEAWVTTPLSCAGITLNAWHEVEAVYYADPADTGCGGNGCLHYAWIAVDGVQTNWNLTRPADNPNNWSNFTLDQYQCDIAGGSKTCTIDFDDAWYKVGTGAYPAGITATTTGGGTGTTTTTTTTVGTLIVRPGGGSLAAGDLQAGQLAIFMYDGVHWQLLNLPPGTSSSSSATSSSLQGAWFQEIPVGALDGSNLDYYLTYTPSSPYVILTENGLTQDPYTRFTLSGNHVHMIDPPRSTDEFVIWYFAGALAGQRSSGAPPSGAGYGGSSSASTAVLNAWVAYPNASPCGHPSLTVSTNGGSSFGSDPITYPTLPFARQLLSSTSFTAPTALSSLQVQAAALFAFCYGSGHADQMYLYDVSITVTFADSTTHTYRPSAYTTGAGDGGFSATNVPLAYDPDVAVPITAGVLGQSDFGSLHASGNITFTSWQ